MNEGELQQMQEELQASEQLLSETQQNLQEKDKTISDLQQTVSTYERKIQQLEQQDTASGDLLQQQPVTTPDTPVVPVLVQKDISKMIWRERESAPEGMVRGAEVVVHGNTAYFRPNGSLKVLYSYQNIVGEEHAMVSATRECQQK